MHHNPTRSLSSSRRLRGGGGCCPRRALQPQSMPAWTPQGFGVLSSPAGASLSVSRPAEQRQLRLVPTPSSNTIPASFGSRRTSRNTCCMYAQNRGVALHGEEAKSMQYEAGTISCHLQDITCAYFFANTSCGCYQ